MVLMDREEYSLKNEWIDEDGNVYFIFTNQELADLLDVSPRTVINIKRNLRMQIFCYRKKWDLIRKLEKRAQSTIPSGT